MVCHSQKNYRGKYPPVRLGEKKVRSEQGVCLGQGRDLDKGRGGVALLGIAILQIKSNQGVAEDADKDL